ncbi:hypothetical protein GCM10027298_24820 [Epidermidibacterium keratini]
MTLIEVSTAAASGLGSPDVGAGCAGNVGPPGDVCGADEVGGCDDELGEDDDDDGADDVGSEEEDDAASDSGSAAQPARPTSNADVTRHKAGRSRMPLVS